MQCVGPGFWKDNEIRNYIAEINQIYCLVTQRPRTLSGSLFSTDILNSLRELVRKNFIYPTMMRISF
jgi:hypothetical protein